MRKMTTEIGGDDRDMVATFAASVEISEKVGDPLLMTREAAIESIMLAQNIPYSPKFRFTVENIPKIIHIGLKAAGEKVKLSEVQEWCFDMGFPQCQVIASEFIALITRPAPEEKVEGQEVGDGEPGEQHGRGT